MKCLRCGCEHDDRLHFCPNCGEKSLTPNYEPEYTHSHSMPTKKRGCLYYGATVIGILILLRVLTLFINTDNTEDTTEGDKYSVSTENKTTPIPIEYNVCDIDSMIDELDDNALKAEKKYNDMHIEITGKLSVIDSDGKYISIESAKGGFLSNDIQCYIKNEKQINQILELHKGDTITIKGKITAVGEILGYSLDIDDIE